MEAFFAKLPVELKVITPQLPENSRLLHTASAEIPLSEITTTQMKRFAASLIETAENFVTAEGYQCVGLSAVQVGIPIRLFVKMSLSTRDFYACFNPTVEILGNEANEEEETCISLPGIRSRKVRATNVRLTYYDAKGTKRVEDHSGFSARIVQHEMDHLNGVSMND